MNPQLVPCRTPLPAVNAPHPEFLRPTGQTAAPLLRWPQTLSLVIPCYNESANLQPLIERATRMLDALEPDPGWEIVFVDDGSRDDTALQLTLWSARDTRLRSVLLSRNFGKEAALTAGLKAARGEVVVLMDADLQHEPELVPTMLHRWSEGHDIVYTRRTDRQAEPLLKRVFTRLFYRLLNTTHPRVRIPADAGDFRLLDRRVVDALNQLPEHSRFMKGLYAWVGFRSVEIPYVPSARAHGRSHYRLRQLASLSLSGMTAFTTWPLRAASVLGVALALLALGYGLWLTSSYLLWGHRISGWTTIVVGMMLLSGVQLLSLGVLGEYVARVFEEVKGRPLYIVARELGQGIAPR
ncbi:MAG: polyisoprenyl-phosphate glycosyltransferase [Pseudomonadota bacterium]|nr:polyisoprenyl-phosphate glycosyltransferase [Pseudomonadota bacterium]